MKKLNKKIKKIKAACTSSITEIKKYVGTTWKGHVTKEIPKESELFYEEKKNIRSHGLMCVLWKT